jgi:redox-sensing transcriptional repressor
MGSDPQRPPFPTIERLALYTRPLEALQKAQVQVVSSEGLAKMCGVNPAQVRKDLAHFGDFGTRGVGYEVPQLLKAIKKILATDRKWRLCIVGIGNLAKALVESENFRNRGYIFVALFDDTPQKIGTLLAGLEILPFSLIPEKIKELGIEIGVITTKESHTRNAAELLVSGGIKAILNFSPVQLRAPEGVLVENWDISVRFERLAYVLGRGLR